jgi:hypothetical protein
MNLEEITQLSNSLTIADLLPCIEDTRNTGKAVIPAEIFCAIQIAGYIRFKLNGENVFVTTERVGRSRKMYLRFHNGRAVSRKEFTPYNLQPKTKMQTMENSFHNTSIRTRSTLSWDQICEMVYEAKREPVMYRTRQDKNIIALHRRIRAALCGMIDCKCGTVR